MVEVLIDAGIDVGHVNRLGWTALDEAIIFGDGRSRYVETISLLLEAGADPNRPWSQDGTTPLDYARRHGQDDAVDVMLGR